MAAATQDLQDLSVSLEAGGYPTSLIISLSLGASTPLDVNACKQTATVGRRWASQKLANMKAQRSLNICFTVYQKIPLY
jgi:hypothetical protein